MRRLTLTLVLLSAALCAPAAFARDLVVADDVTDPMTLDPHKQFSEKNHTICQQIFDGLIRFGPDGKIEPALAVSWQRIDATRTRFKLREGVDFHNGEPFDSAAVRFSLERYLDPGTGFPARAFIDSIDRVETPDRYTVDIVTKYPDGILLNRLAGFILIAPPKYIAEKGGDYFASHPVGTGAFVFRSWEKGKRIVLSANRKYWLSGSPRLEGLVFKFIPQAGQLAALFSGEVDLITDLPGSQTLKVMGRPGLTVQKKASFYTVIASIDRSTGPLSNLYVRQALNHALDKAALVRYDLLGNGWPTASLSMPGEFGHNGSLVPYAFDLKKARELLLKGGYPKGFNLKVLVKANTERTARIIASGLKKIGVVLNTTLVSDADLVAEFVSGKYEMAIGDIPDPMCHSYFLQTLILHSGSPYALGPDPEFDERLDEMASTMDPESLRKKAEALDRYIYENAYSLFTYQRIALYGLSAKVNFVPYLSRMPYYYRTTFYENKKAN